MSRHLLFLVFVHVGIMREAIDHHHVNLGIKLTLHYSLDSSVVLTLTVCLLSSDDYY